VARRAVSVDAPESIESVLETEFVGEDGGPDLNLSVYAVEDAPPALTQVYAEHYASSGLGPGFRTTDLLDLSGLEPRAPVHEETDSLFANARAAHHVIPFANADEHRHVLVTLAADLPARRRPMEKPRSEAYVGGRLHDGDAEWGEFRATAGEKWAKYLAKLFDSHR